MDDVQQWLIEKADYFLTTDKKILNKPISNIKIV
jgi:hypothetical protein